MRYRSHSCRTRKKHRLVPAASTASYCGTNPYPQDSTSMARHGVTGPLAVTVSVRALQQQDAALGRRSGD
eukprot:1702371-Rhodomonas_salina.2